MKKVLVITYYWPPSGGGGVQRWLKFTKYLPEFGWEPIILTPSNPSVLEQDVTLFDDIDPGLKVEKIPIWEPYSVASKLFSIQTIPKQGIVNKSHGKKFSLLRWMRGNMLIPDTRIFWKKAAAKKALSIIKKEKVDIVVTTGPPHSMHLIGLELKAKSNVKWVADFRDPWSDWDILDEMKLSRFARRKHENLEREVINNADLVLSVSKTWAGDLERRYSKKVSVLTNGFDEDDLAKPHDRFPEKFRISHFGLINQYRNVPELWGTLQKLAKEVKGFKDDLEVFLAGNIDEIVVNEIKSCDLIENVVLAGYLKHSDLPQEYDKTAVFLLLTNNSKNALGHIPGKLFEYLYFGRPVLAFCEEKGDVSHLIKTIAPTSISLPAHSDEIEKSVLILYENFKKGRHELQSDGLIDYNRRNLAKNLSILLNSE